MTPIGCANFGRTRIKNACALLLTNDESLEIVAEKCGFASGSYFSKVFKQRTGFSPRDFRKNAP